MSDAITVLDGLDSVRAAVGRDLGTTPWLEVTAAMLDDFAAATGDAAHTYFALSLSNLFLPQIVEVRQVSMGVNYGTGAVRFGAPVAPGARLRAAASLVACEDVKGGVQTTMTIAIEVDGEPEPACVIESLSRWLA